MNSETQHFYKFKAFCLNVPERQLSRDEIPVPLTPKAFDVLAVLVERSGSLVEKEELLRLVWEDAFVEEASVARIVHTIRKSLGEAEQNKFIETVPKKGYRFVAEVEKVNGLPPSQNGFPGETKMSLPETDTQTFLPDVEQLTVESASEKIVHNQTPSARSGKRSAKFWVFAAASIFAVLITGIWFYDDVWTTANTDKDKNENKSIAVLPLKPINNESRDPIYELGIAESLILKLSSAKELTVRPLSATRKYQELDQNPNDAGREQRVDFVLSSNYQIAGGKIRVTSQLINTETGSVEEVFKSEKDSANTFSMEDAIAGDIGNTLLARFGNSESNLPIKRGTSNEEAYRLYLQAAYIFDQWNKTEIGKAIEYLEQAVKLDPNYAEAYTMLGYAYRFFASKTVDSQQKQYAKSKDAIEHALRLNENLADAHAVLGLLKFSYEADFAGAEKEYQRAIQLNSNSPMARALYAHYLMSSGRFNEAIDENNKAMEIDPAASSHQITHGMILYYAHRYDEAVAHFERLVKKDKNFVYAYFWLWLSYDLQGDEAKAYEWFMKYQTQIKAAPETVQMYRSVYQKSGWKGILQQQITGDEEILKNENIAGLYYEIACFSAHLGNKEKAFVYLEKAREQKIVTIMFLKVDPYLDSLHGDSRFDELVKRVGLN